MERIVRLDYFKVVLSLLVITIHTQPLFTEESIAGWLISNGIARIAVPCFFIISGYFIIPKLDDIALLKKYLIHLLVVYIVWSGIYFPVYFQEVEPRSLITFALMGYYHLWYLPALIVGIVLLAIMRRFIKRDKIILFTGVILFFIGYYLEYRGVYYRYYCNGIFFGYPFVALGYCVNTRNWQERFKGIYLYVFLIGGAILLLVDSYLGYILNIYKNMIPALYIFCPMLFILILRNARSIPDKGYAGKLAAGIYYVHILVLTLIIPLAETDNIYKYPLIALVSILLSIFIIFVNKRIKIFL